MFAQKLFKNYPLSTRLLVFALLPICLLMLWGWSYLRTSLPDVQGNYQVEYISDQVKIDYDQHGMVHIAANSDKDAYFALGYAHGSDRLWQLELQRRIATGTLSELLGRQALNQDVWIRTLGLSQSAEQAWLSLSDEAKAALEAYSAGINARVAQLEVLPVEFIMMGVEPTAWRPVDSLAWMKVFALNLAGNMWSELSHMAAQQWLTPEQSAALIKHYPQDGAVTVSSFADDSDMTTVAELFSYKDQLQQLDIGGRYVGSNAWVIGPQHSENGQAQLANDPHLGLQMPSLWYAASMKGDKLAATGMTLVGLPLVIFGRNQNIVWGGTNMMADAQDLVLETLPQNHQFVERVEQITVKAESPASLRVPLAPVTLTVRETENGPVVSDALKGFSQVISLQWTALDKQDTSFEAFYRLGYAQNWQQFKQALSYHVAPALNMLYADKQNNIGYQGIGRIPVRAKGEGMLPYQAAGFTGTANNWQGYVPYEQMPTAYNPTKGYLVSANNKVVDDSYEYFISNEWADPARAERIEQLIGGQIKQGKKIPLDFSMSMQQDEVDLSMMYLRDFLLSQKAQIATDYQPLVELLANWDGSVSGDSAVAALLHVLTRHLQQELFLSAIEKSYGQEQQYRVLKRLVDQSSHRQLVAAFKTGVWCQASECGQVLNDSFAAAVAELDLFLGDSPQDWAWSDLHQANYSHMPFSQINLLDRWFTRKPSRGGSANSLNVSNAQYIDLEGYEKSFGAGFRQVISIGKNSTEHFYVNSTGQSGSPLSPHYDDGLNALANGEFFSTNIESDAVSQVTLSPVSAKQQVQ